MSFLRMGSGLTFVEGNSVDYVFHSVGGENNGEGFIEDYGTISNSGLADILCGVINRSEELDDIEKIYFMKKLCEKLKVTLKPSVEVVMKI